LSMQGGIFIVIHLMWYGACIRVILHVHHKPFNHRKTGMFYKKNMQNTIWLFLPGIIFDIFKGIVSKLTIKFWMCQKCGKMKNYNNRKIQVLQNDYKHTGYDNNYHINLDVSFWN
jgi:hypothetical protein